MLIKCQMPATKVHDVIILTQARFTKHFIITFNISLSQNIGGGWGEKERDLRGGVGGRTLAH